jgi:uncharacterized membrane protein
MNLDTPTIIALIVFLISLLGLLAGAAVFLSRKRTPSNMAPASQPYSISRALDELKYQHADAIIGQTLGTSHAVDLASRLGPMAKPPELPKS